jgi:hypothetical protein
MVQCTFLGHNGAQQEEDPMGVREGPRLHRGCARGNPELTRKGVDFAGAVWVLSGGGGSDGVVEWCLLRAMWITREGVPVVFPLGKE